MLQPLTPPTAKLPLKSPRSRKSSLKELQPEDNSRNETPSQEHYISAHPLAADHVKPFVWDNGLVRLQQQGISRHVSRDSVTAGKVALTHLLACVF